MIGINLKEGDLIGHHIFKFGIGINIDSFTLKKSYSKVISINSNTIVAKYQPVHSHYASGENLTIRINREKQLLAFKGVSDLEKMIY